MYKKNIKVDIEEMSFDRKIKIAELKELYTLYESHQMLEGMLFRFSKSPNFSHIFYPNGRFKKESVQKEFFIKEVFKFLKEFQEKNRDETSIRVPLEQLEKVLKSDSDILNFVFGIISTEPMAISDVGLTVKKIRDSIEERVVDITADPIKQEQIIDYVTNKLLSSDLQKYAEGTLNKIYKLEIDGVITPILIAVRLPLEKENMTEEEKERRVWLNSYSAQIEIQEKLYDEMNKIQQQFPETNYAKIPEPYYSGIGGSFMTMEFVDNSFALGDICKKIHDPEQLKEFLVEVEDRLRNTLEFWSKGENGKPLFRHYDLHPGNILIKRDQEGAFEDVYIIDFDFSAFNPYELRPFVRPSRVVYTNKDGVRFVSDSQSFSFIEKVMETLK